MNSCNDHDLELNDFYFRETDKYFRNLINYLSCDFERKQNAGIQSSPDFVSLMLQNSISEEEGKDPNKERFFTTIHAELPF